MTKAVFLSARASAVTLKSEAERFKSYHTALGISPNSRRMFVIATIIVILDLVRELPAVLGQWEDIRQKCSATQGGGPAKILSASASVSVELWAKPARLRKLAERKPEKRLGR